MKQATTRMLFSYWDALRGARAAPERGEIEPGAIRHVLPDTFILELDRDRRAAIRLAGTRLCALFGGELRDRSFASLWPNANSAEVRRCLDIVVDDTAGVVVGLVGTTPREARVDLEMVLLPLRHRGQPHVRVLGGIAPAIVPAWLGFDAVTRLETVSVRVLLPTPALAIPVPDVEVEVHRDPVRRFVVYEGGRGAVG
jgi:hypothetical protein